jgi:hypothetical protein
MEDVKKKVTRFDEGERWVLMGLAGGEGSR